MLLERRGIELGPEWEKKQERNHWADSALVLGLGSEFTRVHRITLSKLWTEKMQASGLEGREQRPCRSAVAARSGGRRGRCSEDVGGVAYRCW